MYKSISEFSSLVDKEKEVYLHIGNNYMNNIPTVEVFVSIYQGLLCFGKSYTNKSYSYTSGHHVEMVYIKLFLTRLMKHQLKNVVIVTKQLALFLSIRSFYRALEKGDSYYKGHMKCLEMMHQMHKECGGDLCFTILLIQEGKEKERYSYDGKKHLDKGVSKMLELDYGKVAE